MKKLILFILSVLITSLSFAAPKDWVDENKLRKAGYEFYPGTPKYSHYPIVFKKVLDNGDVLCINILDHRRYETYGFDGAYLDETIKILDEILGVEEGGEGKKILENDDLMIGEYYNENSIKGKFSHSYLYVFYYFFTVDDDFIFAEYFSKKKLSKDTLDKMSGQIFDDFFNNTHYNNTSEYLNKIE